MATILTRAKAISAFSLRIVHYLWSHKMYSTESIKQILHNPKTDQPVHVKGWVKSVQQHKGITFLHIDDGSGPQQMQVVVPQPLAQSIFLTFGSCVEIHGIMKQSCGKDQNVELLCTTVNVIGSCSPNEFPLKRRTKHSPQYMRDFLHIRPKTNIFSALLRIRNVASMAVHSFFQSKDYLFIHTPILTSSDCEGSCEVFKVESLKNESLATPYSSSCNENDAEGNDPQIYRTVITHDEKYSDISRRESASSCFFGLPTFLTVSGQLHLEVMIGAFTKVYNFGPVFRAENSSGSFHLSEFYMIEAEVAFIENMEYLQSVMEDLVKYVWTSVMNECQEDFSIFMKYVAPPQHLHNLNRIMESRFERVSYTDAISILKNSKENFQFKVSWGCDFKKEHEMYLTKAIGNIPVFISDYPMSIKPFYARRNDDMMTVATSDLLMPGVGELCGSSLREERVNILKDKMTQMKLIDQLTWYHQLRRFGSCPHGGFGLGFERLIMALLGAHSVKDVIPFPRWSRNCKI